MPLKAETLSISICDAGDIYPIHYKLSSQTTMGFTVGWHLIEILDETFKKELTFRHDMLPQFIAALTKLQDFLEEK